VNIAYLLNYVFVHLSGPGLKSAPMLYRLFLNSGSVIFDSLKASFVNRLRHCWKIFCQTFWEIRLKRSFEKLSLKVSGIFNGAEFIIFTALMKHKRRIFEKSAQHSYKLRVGKPNGMRVVSLWKSNLLCWKTVWKSEEIYGSCWKAFVGQNYLFLNFEKPPNALCGPSGGLLEFWSK
jgi:hypothetical protein